MGVAAQAALLAGAQQRSAGKIANTESKVEAEQIKTAAASREADRKRDLARAAASQSAAAGASGIGFEGSPLTILQEDIAVEERAGKRDELMTRLGVISARARGKVAHRQATGQAILGLLQAGASSAQMSAPGGPGSEQSAGPKGE